MSRMTITRLVLLALIVAALSMLLGGEPWGPI
jgi:hypothetical protein